MSEAHERGVLDTSVIIDMPNVPDAALPASSTVTTITLAELAAGLHTTASLVERAGRAERLQRVEAYLEPLSFDSAAARSYGRMVALTIAGGRNPRPRRLDLMIAATAAANRLPLFTRNPTDFEDLGSAVTVVPV